MYWVRYGSDSRIRYGNRLILLLLDIVVCDLYFDSHILVVLFVILILSIHIHCINYVCERVLGIFPHP